MSAWRTHRATALGWGEPPVGCSLCHRSFVAFASLMPAAAADPSVALHCVPLHCGAGCIAAARPGVAGHLAKDGRCPARASALGGCCLGWLGGRCARGGVPRPSDPPYRAPIAPSERAALRESPVPVRRGWARAGLRIVAPGTRCPEIHRFAQIRTTGDGLHHAPAGERREPHPRGRRARADAAALPAPSVRKQAEAKPRRARAAPAASAAAPASVTARARLPSGGLRSRCGRAPESAQIFPRSPEAEGGFGKRFAVGDR